MTKSERRLVAAFIGHLVVPAVGIVCFAVWLFLPPLSYERGVRFLAMAAGPFGAFLLASTYMGWLRGVRAVEDRREALYAHRAFVSAASHELRTPLTVIRAEAEVLSGLSREPEATEALARIVEEADRAGARVSRVLSEASESAEDPPRGTRPSP